MAERGVNLNHVLTLKEDGAKQLATRCFPDEDTCGIQWLVVQAACNDLARVLQGKDNFK